MRIMNPLPLFLALLAPFAPSVRLEADPICCPEYAYNLPTRFQEDCCLWYGHVDALVLQARNSFAPVEITQTRSIQNGLITNSATPSELKYDWKGAFRLGIGAHLPGDRFAVSLDWFHYKNTTGISSGSANDRVSTIIPYIDIISSNANALIFGSNTNYSSYASLHLNELDLSIRREYVLTWGIVLAPKIGVTYLDIKSPLNLNIVPVNFPAPSLLIETLNRFYGLGIKGGIDSAWELGCGFGLFSQLQTGLIWGRYQTRALFTTTENQIPGLSTFSRARYVHQNLVPTFDIAIGLVWDHLCANGSAIRLKAGWEGFYYYDQTTFNLEPELVSNPLTLQGAVVSLSYSM